MTQIVGPGDPHTYLQLVIGLTLLKGLIQLVFALARMGNLVKYVSQSVIIGFAAGVGVLIGLGQVPIFLGIETTRSPDGPIPGRDRVGATAAPTHYSD
ncbi:MAG: SulP family inorganic anion transporter [Phycisphaerales bacterium]